MNMDYDEWISRERRIRANILKNSLVIKNRGTCRVCQYCREICLCHEQTCPNCNADNIAEERIDNIDEEVYKRIRCRFRFDHIG